MYDDHPLLGPADPLPGDRRNVDRDDLLDPDDAYGRLDPDGLEERQSRRISGRRGLLLAAAAVPWLIVVALLVRSTATGADPDIEDVAVADEPGAAQPGPIPSGEPIPSTVPVPTTGQATVTRAGGQPNRQLQTAIALAVPIARDFLGGLGPPIRSLTTGTEDPARDDSAVNPADTARPTVADTYVEHLVPEAVDFPLPGAAVVTVLAVVLDVEDSAYVNGRLERVAVPVRFDGPDVALAGSPWRLPVTPLRTEALQREPVANPDLQMDAAAAIEDAGFDDVRLVELARTDSWPWIATVDAVGPGSREPRRHVLWLRPHLGRFVLAGTSTDQAIRNRPAGTSTLGAAGAEASNDTSPTDVPEETTP